MSTVKFGVIGAGGIATRRTIPAMLEASNCELVGLMDVVDSRKVAAVFDVPRTYETVEDLLADPDVQAVYIASPAARHHEQILAAAEAGKHVLCEKPLTLTVAEAEQAVAACDANGVFLQEGYMMKFHGAHTMIRRLIADGKIGDPVYLRAQLSCWYPPIEGAWRQDPATGGGGALIDMATHLYDLLEYFAGPIRRVVAFTGNLVQDYASEDAATTLLEFETGAHATVDTFFCIPDDSTKTRLEIYGSRGSILTEGTMGQGSGGTVRAIADLGEAGYDAEQSKDGKRRHERVKFPQVNPYTLECEHFAGCILAGRPPEINDGANAIHIARVTKAAYASAKDGQARVVE